MESIIKKAIEGGWKQPIGYEFVVAINTRRFGKNIANEMFFVWILSQSVFWQALGKACAWESKIYRYNCTNENCDYGKDADFESMLDGYCQKCGEKRTCFQKDFKEWLIKAKSFHEINLTGGWNAAVEYLQEITK